MQIGDLLNKLEKVKRLSNGEYQACCPAHEDKKPSLTIKLEGDKLLVNCFAGCTPEAIVQSLNLTMSDLFIEKSKPIAVATKLRPAPSASEKIIATYDYKDEKGNILFQVVRFDPKDFRQRHKNGNGDWVWNLENVRRVLYHLPDIAPMIDETIYLVEGEKDCDNLWEWGQPSTTSPGGASAWKSEYADYLIGKRVVIIPDKDASGMSYARQVANSIIGKAREVKIIMLPGDKVKDTTDWLNSGGDIAALPEMEQDIEVLFTSDKPTYRQLEDSVQWDKKVGNLLLTFKGEKISEERTGVHARISIFGQREMLSWSYLNIERREDRSGLSTAAFSTLPENKEYGKDDLRRDIDNFCAGLWEFHLSRFVPTEMIGDDTPQPLVFILKPYLIEGGGTIIFAPPGRGKSYTALLWGVAIDSGCQNYWQVTKKTVLFVNLERSAESLRRRLGAVNKVLGLPASRPLLTLNARGKSLNEVIPACRKAIKKYNVGLVALDSISRAGLGDLNENQSGNRVIDALSSMCPTWLALGHTSRASDEHLYGSIMQDAGADICIQISSQIKDDGVLGIGWQITKQNDIGIHAQKIYALEFNEYGLINFRPAKTFEFPDIEGNSPLDMLTTVIDWISNQDSGDATATEIEKEFGFTRANVSRLFTKSGKFVVTRKVKQSVYYGVKADKTVTKGSIS